MNDGTRGCRRLLGMGVAAGGHATDLSTAMKLVAAVLLAALTLAACNTMDGLVTDVDRGVSKVQGEDRNRR